MLDALVELVARQGYSATSVADIIKVAGVSRTTFYEQFADKEACFLAAYDEGARAHYALVVRAIEAAGDPLEKLREGVRSYLETLARQPAFARTMLLEVIAAGPRALKLREQAQMRYVALLRTVHEQLRARSRSLPAVSDEVILAATAAIDELIVRRVRERARIDRDGLERTALYVLFALLSMPEQAASCLSPRTGRTARSGARRSAKRA